VSLPGQKIAQACRDDRGALTLTYVVILPVFFLFLMSVIQASFWFLARDAALAAARQGADAARATGSSLTAGHAEAMSFAHQAGSGYLLGPSAWVRQVNAATISVTVYGHVPSFVPGLTVHVHETVQVPVEVFHS
jgi:Flp pilus assembly protein TadG